MSKTVLQKNFNIPVHMTDTSTFDDSFSYMKERFQAEMRRVSEEMNKFSSDLMRLYASPFVNNAIASRANSSVASQQLPQAPQQLPQAPQQLPQAPQQLPQAPQQLPQAPQTQALPEPPQKKGKKGKKGQAKENTSALSDARKTSHSASAQPDPSKTTQDISEAMTTEESLASDHANWSAITESPLILVEGESKKLKLQFDVSQFDPAEVKVQILDDVLYVKAKHDERTDNSMVLREYSQQFMLPKGIDPEAVISSLSRDGVLTVEAPLPQLVLELGKELQKIKADKK